MRELALLDLTGPCTERYTNGIRIAASHYGLANLGSRRHHRLPSSDRCYSRSSESQLNSHLPPWQERLDWGQARAGQKPVLRFRGTLDPARHASLRFVGRYSGPTHSSMPDRPPDRKSTRLNSSHVEISYAVFCLKKKKKIRCRYTLHKKKKNKHKK